MASTTARDISKCMRVCYLRVVGDWHSDAVLIRDVVGAVIWRAWARAGCAATCRVWNARRHTNQTHKKPAAVWNKTLSVPFACLLPAMSSERFLAVVMGLSRRRSSGLLLRSLTFCFSRERSFRLGSDAERRLKRDQILFLKSNLNTVIVSA